MKPASCQQCDCHRETPRFINLLLALGLALSFSLFSHAAIAQEEEPYRLRLVVDQAPNASWRDGSAYRQAHHDKTIAVMLFGFQPGQNNNSPAPAPEILKDRRALSGFFKQHWNTVKRDYLGQDGTQAVRLLAAEESFTSATLNRGLNEEPAKMVGFTIPAGAFTWGGGYTWGEKNPAVMLRATDGLMMGVSYESETTSFQISYLTSGQEVAGMEIGGTNIRYDSLMFGTSWRVNERIGVTATAQYRHDNDPLTTGAAEAVFTIGTRWKF